MRSKPCLSLIDVKRILAVCEAEAIKNEWAVSISVVDDSGFLLGFERMDGAGPATFEASLGKARTSGMTRRPSKVFEDRVKERPGFVTFPAGILIQGGVPIMYQNACVGGIGVSGVLSHEDELIAFAGAKALE
jgi:uncharacterized protein GlcG (DUF336 family)